MVQMENVEGEAEQQPFSSNLHIAPKQKTPEIKILLHIRKVALGLNGTVHPNVEEHIPCHKGAYTGKSGITRDRTGKPWYYRNLKR